MNIDANARGHVKTIFDGNIISNFDAFEMFLDYTFVRLGVEGDGSGGIGHPIVMTEAVCNPTYSRKSKHPHIVGRVEDLADKVQWYRN